MPRPQQAGKHSEPTWIWSRAATRRTSRSAPYVVNAAHVPDGWCHKCRPFSAYTISGSVKPNSCVHLHEGPWQEARGEPTTLHKPPSATHAPFHRRIRCDVGLVREDDPIADLNATRGPSTQQRVRLFVARRRGRPRHTQPRSQAKHSAPGRHPCHTRRQRRRLIQYCSTSSTRTRRWGGVGTRYGDASRPGRGFLAGRCGYCSGSRASTARS